jgi:hypothetical protein
VREWAKKRAAGDHIEKEEDGGDWKRMKTGNSRGQKRSILLCFWLLVIKSSFFSCSVNFLSFLYFFKNNFQKLKSRRIQKKINKRKKCVTVKVVDIIVQFR